MVFYRRTGGVATRARLQVNGGGGVKPSRRSATPPPVVSTADTVYAYEPLGAGGWVTGINISPDGNTRIARTDTMAAWYWDTVADAWEICVSGSSMPAGSKDGRIGSSDGVQAVAVSNGSAFMGYNNSIYKSTDGGRNWVASLEYGPITKPNIGSQKWANNALNFDPANSSRLIYGTFQQGVWYTLDGGTTWAQVPASSVPFGKADWGVPCTAIDATGAWYAASYNFGVYRSTNQGTTWTKISVDTNFTSIYGMKVAGNGDIVVTADSDVGKKAPSFVWRYRAGVWSNITPTEGADRSWRSIAFDPSSPGRLLLQAIGGYHKVSTDYGTTWLTLARQFYSGGDVTWHAPAQGGELGDIYLTLGGLEFDPVVPGRVWMSQGIGVWYADLNTDPAGFIKWHAHSRGIEQMITIFLLAPPGGPTLAMGWDRKLFVVGETV